MSPRPRSGAALIIVLLILAALMVLGLPFLFSQSSGLAGTRSFQASQAAHIYRQSAENLGVALAAYSSAGAWKETNGTDLNAQIHTALKLYLNDSLALKDSLIDDGPNRVPFDIAKLPSSWNMPGEHVRIGVAISDESGLLDANTLSAQDWQDLFKQTDIQIPDWDDNEVVVNWDTTHENYDNNTTGELADTLVYRRLVRGRFTRLEELMDADPQKDNRYNGGPHHEFRKRLSRAEIERLRPYLSFHNPAPGRDGQIDLGSVVYTDIPPSSNYLPPKVWMDIPGNIVADGQWVWVEDGPKGKPHQGTIYAPNYDNLWINYSPWTLRPGNDSAIVWQAPPALNLHQMSPLIRSLPAYATSDFPTDPILPIPTEPVRFYGQEVTTTPPPNTQTNNALPPGFLKPWYHRVANPTPPAAPLPPHARQPIDLRSNGSIRVEASATVRNHLGDLTAQESRTVIMQVVPQQTRLERRWLTQGQFEPLIDQRLASQMVTWPNATARANDLAPDDVDPDINPSPTLTAETGISFKPLPSLATSATTHLDVTWRAPLGAGTNLAAADALKDSQNKDAGVPGEIDNPTPIQDAVTHEGLFPDGVRIGPSKALAYELSDPTNGAFTFRSPPPVPPATGSIDSTIGPRHLSFWFQPQTDWTASTVVTLMELRPSPGYTTTVAPDIDDPAVIIKNITSIKTTDCQNYLGVLYDKKQNMLVLVYTPPSVSIADSATSVSLLNSPLTWLIQNDAQGTADVDERSLPGLGLSTEFPLVVPRGDSIKMAAWSPTLKPNRIMTCYKLGRRLDSDGTTPIANTPEVGRWYNLQIAMGDGRPGGMSIILDGNVGNDVGVMPASEYFNSRRGSRLEGPWPGDHLTFPNLILTQVLPAIDKSVNDPTTANSFMASGITVEMPGFSSFGDDDYSGTANPILSPSMTLPRRGSVLIGDEYIRYENIVNDASDKNKATLINCWRGDRQDTWTNSPTLLEQLPSTQSHAINDRVIADGMRLKLYGTDNLYQGGEKLATEFKVGNAADAYALTSAFSATTDVHLLTDPLTLVSGGTFEQAPSSGFAYVNTSKNQSYIFWYVKLSNGTVTLSKPDILSEKIPTFLEYPLPVPPDRIDNSGVDVSGAVRLARIWLASVETTEINSPMAANSFGYGVGFTTPAPANYKISLIQLLDITTGRCEWLHYTERIKVAGKRARIFFINRYAWYYDTVTHTRTRGMERTKPTASFPSGTTLVLPVITDFGGGYGKLLATGDLVTLVPRTYDGIVKNVALAIRYCANDGYDGNATNPFNDTVNGRFAFTTPLGPLRVSANGSDYDIVMGSGLTTLRDLTPLTNHSIRLPLAALPRLDAHKDAKDPRVIFGSADTARGGVANSTTMMAIDALAAGPWDSSASRVLRVFDGSGTQLPGIPASGGLPCFIWVNDDVFSGPEPLSLLEIGGEVFACERLQDSDWPTMQTALTTATAAFPELLRVNNVNQNPADYLKNFPKRFARLVGRGQMGSRPMAHTMNASPNANQITQTQARNFGNLDYGPECMTLPIGPVRYLDDSANLVANTWFTLKGSPDPSNLLWKGANVTGKEFTAPYALVVEASPTATYPWDVASEIIGAGNYDDRQNIQYYDPSTGLTSTNQTNLNFGKRITPKWLRGLYNTDATHNWQDQGTLKPLVIGWWPRFPSSYPSLTGNSGSPGTLTAQHLRCRFYPWIGFPMNLHGIRFDNTPEGVPQILFDPTLPANDVLTKTSGLAGSLPNLQIEVRAMAGSINGLSTVPGAIGDTNANGYSDWSSILVVKPNLTLITTPTWQTVDNLFKWNSPLSAGPDLASPTTGVEVRVTFRYTGHTSNDLSDIARAANRAPLISGFKLRAHAPVTTLAVESAR